jgi:hypothetical protein
MTVATSKGKQFALDQLAKRRKRNANLKPVDNSRAYAGSPMIFNCIGCNGEIAVSESYTTRPKFCEECQALNACGWLE